MAYLNESKEVREVRDAFCAMVRQGGCPAMCKIKQWARLKNVVIKEAFGKAGMQVPAEAIEPFGLLTVRELIRSIRKAYKDWDNGLITQTEFNDRAHRINDEYELWEQLGRVSDDDMWRYHDEYAASIMAANDVAEL